MRKLKFGVLAGLVTWIGCFLLVAIGSMLDPIWPCNLHDAIRLGLIFAATIGSLLAVTVGMLVASSTPARKGIHEE